MDYLGKMRLFVRVVETGSFSRAGKAERVAQSTVSKEISSLEGRLGAHLIRRNSHGLSITELGQEYYDFAVGILRDLEAAESRIRSGSGSPRGRVRVAAPPVLSSELIIPALPSLFARYPDLAIDLEVSERYVSLVEDGVDVAIRLGHLEDSSLVARQIGCVEAQVVGSPAYLDHHGVPMTLDDLKHHNCIPFMFQGGSKTWKFKNSEVDVVVVPSAKLRTNDAEGVLAAVYAGLGLAQGPSWMFAGEIAAGRLVPVLADFGPRLFPVHAISSGTRRKTGAIKVFVDFVADLMKSEPHLRIR